MEPRQAPSTCRHCAHLEVTYPDGKRFERCKEGRVRDSIPGDNGGCVYFLREPGADDEPLKGYVWRGVPFFPD